MTEAASFDRIRPTGATDREAQRDEKSEVVPSEED
jgi:hypothetical protein